MEMEKNSFTLTGFRHLINRVPVQFIDRIPENFVCIICGQIPSRILRLRCLHTICSTCLAVIDEYEDVIVCHLDETEISGETVLEKLNIEDILRDFNAKCPNNSNGCAFAGKFFVVVQHFATECNCHAVRCKICGATVVHEKILDHFKSKCEDHKIEDGAGVGEFQKSLMKQVQTITHSLNMLRNERNEIKHWLEDNTSELKEYFDEAMRPVHSLKDDFKRVLPTKKVQLLEVPRRGSISGGALRDQSPPAPKAFNSEGDQIGGDCTELIHQIDRKLSKLEVSTCPTRFTWQVKPFWALRIKLEAEEHNMLTFESPPFFICDNGYKAIIGGHLTKRNSDICLSLLMKLQVGPNDAHLQWPFRRRCTFTLVNRNCDFNRTWDLETVTANPEAIACLSRPMVEDNEFWGVEDVITIQEMLDDGFLVNDSFTMDFVTFSV